MSCKRGEITGFDGGKVTEARKISWRKNKVEGDWRHVTRVRIEYTMVKRTWTWNDNEFVEKHISPWGIVETVKDILKSSKLLNSYNSLPLDVKGHSKK